MEGGTVMAKAKNLGQKATGDRMPKNASVG
jgi:hypothetical protein